MSLMGALAKVAIGMAVAKGVKSITSGGSKSSGGGLGDLLGQLGGGATGGQSGGGLGDILGQLGGAQRQQPKSGGGLGDLLGQLAGGSSPRGGASTGLEDIMGGVFNKAPQAGGSVGGLGGLLDSLAGSSARAGTGSGGMGDMLNQSFERFGEPEPTPSADQEASAGVMLKAMLQAAKSDGRIDDAEKEAIFKNLGDISAQEMEFVNSVLSAPVDAKALAREVPAGSEAQTYAMSLIACDLDSQVEAEYLNSFAVALGLQESQVNQIHEQMNEPPLYA